MKQPILKVMVVISLIYQFLFGAYQVGYSFILIEKLKIMHSILDLQKGHLRLECYLLSIYFSTRKELKFPFLVSKWGIVVLGVLMGAVALPLLISMSYI